MFDDRNQGIKLIRLQKVEFADAEGMMGYKAVTDLIRLGIEYIPFFLTKKAIVPLIVILALWGLLWLVSPLIAIAIPVLLVALIFFSDGSALEVAMEVVKYRSYRPNVANTLISYGICPQCAGSLRALPAEHDGCVVCPTCGGTYQQYRITRQLTPSDKPKQAGGFLSWLFQTKAKPSEKYDYAIDDAGCFVEVLKPEYYSEIDKNFDETGGKWQEFMHSVNDSPRRQRKIIMTIFAGVVIILLAYLVIFVGPAWRSGAPSAREGFLLILGIPFAAVILSKISPKATASIDGLLSWGLCPGCGQGLDEQGLHESGLMVCPACHAAWNLKMHEGEEG